MEASRWLLSYCIKLISIDMKNAFDSLTKQAMDEARKTWGLTNGKFVKLLLKLQEISFFVEGLSGSSNSKTYKQEEGVGAGGPESPAMFLMVLAWFLVAMKRDEEQKIDREILEQEKALLPVRENMHYEKRLELPP